MSTHITGGLPPLLDRDLFFGEIQIGGAQISPDGHYISFLKPFEGMRNIWVKKASEPFSAARPITAEKHRPILHYFWSRDSRFILYVQDQGGDENYNIYAVDPTAEPAPGQVVPAARNITDAKGARTFIYSLPQKQPDILYAGLNDRDPSWPDLYRVRISTGERELLRQNTERIASWVFDNAGNLRLAVRVNDAGDTEILRVDPDQFTPVYSCSIHEICAPLKFDAENQTVFLITNKGEDLDLLSLAALDPANGRARLVETDPLNRADLSEAVFSKRTDELLATIYEDDRKRIYWKNPAFEADHRWLEQRFPEREIDWLSHTADESRWIILVHGDTEPGEVYLLDRETRSLELQYRVREQIPREVLAPRQSIRYRSSDGLEIPAYLTLPKGVEPRNLPLMVVPHGGPWARDSWGYDAFAQFFANRGYAVLQPNFRGSTGYGKRFLNAGNGEWGRKMQDDLTWGVRYLIEQGIADPKRVGIAGGSYGGYAALAGVAFTPELYAAAVSIVGPSNLITLLESIPPYWEAERKIMYARIADPDTPEGRKRLEEQSPLHAASRIRAPLMVVQGANDPRVNKRESDQIVVALRERGIDVAYLVAPDEGHGFARPVNNLAMIMAMERFLGEHLRARFQESATEEVKNRLREITVDPKDVTLQPRIEPKAGELPEPMTDLCAGVSRYRATLTAGDQMFALEISSEIQDAGERWKAIQTMQTPMGTFTDTVEMEKRTLLACARHVRQGPLAIDLRYDNHRATGTLSMNGQSKPVAIDLGGPVFADAAGAMESIAALPLQEGYRAVFRNVDIDRQKAKWMQLRVLGSERITVPAGVFEVYRIEVEPAESSAGRTTIWVEKQQRKPVKYQSVLPEMGGAVLTAELLGS